MDNKKVISPDMLEASRKLREHQTKAEKHLWDYLRKRRLAGMKFKRQAVIDRFVVDFYCHEHRLVVEIDGSIHDNPDIKAYDVERQGYLEACGYRVLRFRNDEVLEYTGKVLKAIEVAVKG